MILPVRWFRVAMLAVTCAVIAVSGGRTAEAADALTSAQEEAVRGLIRSYILENPEIVYEAIHILQTRQEAEQKLQRQAGIGALGGQLDADRMIPVVGNPKGDVTVIEFFDYNCPYCRRVVPVLRAAMEGDPQVRVQLVEFPVLGESSEYAARAALASIRQGKYFAFHEALMEAPGRVGEDSVMAIAGDVGLDVDQLKKDMNSEEIDSALKRNAARAQALDIRGTPAFIIGDELMPGAISTEQMIGLINKARKG